MAYYKIPISFYDTLATQSSNVSQDGFLEKYVQQNLFFFLETKQGECKFLPEFGNIKFENWEKEAKQNLEKFGTLLFPILRDIKFETYLRLNEDIIEIHIKGKIKSDDSDFDRKFSFPLIT